jgi:urease accessory protein
MLAVGIWGTQLGGRMIWTLPLAFAGCMAAGGALALVPLPNWLVESVILASVIALGTLIMLALRTPPVLAIALVGGFALFHGYAHLAERGAGGSAFAYGVGMLAGTALLHGAGVLLALSLRRAESGRRLVRVGGVFILACGVLLMAGAI